MSRTPYQKDQDYAKEALKEAEEMGDFLRSLPETPEPNYKAINESRKSDKKTIAVAMICKNEEALIGRALESVKWADAIYVCDTGSTDGTLDVVRKYTDNVCLSFVWVDDFSLAQNHCKSHVKESIDTFKRYVEVSEWPRLSLTFLRICQYH